jgi:hypothetical protein
MVTESKKRANKKYFSSEKGKEVLRNQYEKEKGKPRRKAREIRSHMKHGSIKRGLEWREEWWSLDEIEQIVLNGVCCKTGIKFTVERMNGTGNRNPFNASPDRLDNSKGYEPSNVQWVVFIYNLMKNNFKDSDVKVFVEALTTHSS